MASRRALGRRKEVAVVGLAFLWRTKDGVCFADGHEAFRFGRVVWVQIWVVGFGEFVELPVG